MARDVSGKRPETNPPISEQLTRDGNAPKTGNSEIPPDDETLKKVLLSRCKLSYEYEYEYCKLNCNLIALFSLLYFFFL